MLEFGQALPFVGVNGAINNRAAVDAFPGIEDEEEVRESFHHHQALALWTVHKALQISIRVAYASNAFVSRFKQIPSPKMY
jgi:hypothetical protein